MAEKGRPVFLAVNAPTLEVQTSDFTGFFDPKNVGVGIKITVLSTLVSKL